MGRPNSFRSICAVRSRSRVIISTNPSCNGVIMAERLLYAIVSLLLVSQVDGGDLPSLQGQTEDAAGHLDGGAGAASEVGVPGVGEGALDDRFRGGLREGDDA